VIEIGSLRKARGVALAACTATCLLLAAGGAAARGAAVVPWLHLRADAALATPESIAPPAVGASYTEAEFATRITRVTESVGTFGTAPEYSKVQAFNANGSRLLLRRTDATWVLHDGRSLRRLGPAGLPGGEIEPRWSPRDPDRLSYLRGDSVWSFSLRSGRSRLVARFPELGRLSSGGEQDVSLDGRFIAVHGPTTPIDGPFEQTRAFVVDLATGRRGPIRLLRPPTAGETLDYVSITPDGTRVLVMWSSHGAVLYTRNWRRLRRLTTWDEHGDVCRGDGRWWFVTSHYRPETNDTVVEAVPLNGKAKRILWRAPRNMGLHVSCRATGVPGWAIVSTYWHSQGRPRPMPVAFDNEVFALSLTSSVEAPVVRRLATTRMVERFGYGDEPHATVSRDGGIVLFGSSFQRSPTPLQVPETWAIDLRGN